MNDPLKLSQRYILQNGVHLMLTGKNTRWVPGDIRRELEKRHLGHVFILEIDTGNAEKKKLTQVFEEGGRLKAVDLLLGRATDDVGKVTAYLMPDHDSVMAMAETGILPSTDLEKAFRDKLRELARKNRALE